jgi:hypothetical protein
MKTEEIQRICMLSVIAFLKIIAATNRSPVLACYRLHEGLLQRMPNYRVRMGFGLHKGWAIEGAIGSEFKVRGQCLLKGWQLRNSIDPERVQGKAGTGRLRGALCYIVPTQRHKHMKLPFSRVRSVRRSRTNLSLSSDICVTFRPSFAFTSCRTSFGRSSTALAQGNCTFGRPLKERVNGPHAEVFG